MAELKDLWWREAERFQVLPLNNQPGLFGDPRYRRDRYEFLGQVGPLAEALAPNLKNRSFVIAAELVPQPDRVPTGVIAAHGSHAGGYVLFIGDGRLHFTYNYVATQITTDHRRGAPALRTADRAALSSRGPAPGATSSCSTATSPSATARSPGPLP